MKYENEKKYETNRNKKTKQTQHKPSKLNLISKTHNPWNYWPDFN
jgi:hypothetical protein